MNGDLSLSGSLGGLRIANPDDEASSPTVPSADYSRYETPIHTSQSDAAERYRQHEQNVYTAPIAMESTGSLDVSAYLANLNAQRSRALEELVPQPMRHPSNLSLIHI